MSPLLPYLASEAPWWVTPASGGFATVAAAIGWMWRDERAQRLSAHNALIAAHESHAKELASITTARLLERDAHKAELIGLMDTSREREDDAKEGMARIESMLQRKGAR